MSPAFGERPSGRRPEQAVQAVTGCPAGGGREDVGRESFTGMTPPVLPFRRTGDPLDPPPELRRWQREESLRRISVSGVSAWLVTRHADVRQLLADPRLSSDPSRPGYPPWRPDQPPPVRGHLAFMDPPEHTGLRRIVMTSMLVDGVNRLRPAIERRTHELLDDLVGMPQPVDLVQSFSLELPVRVICELLGVPFSDRKLFIRWALKLTRRSASGGEITAVHASLTEHIGRLIEAKDLEPADDLLSELVVRHVRSGRITREQAVGIGLQMLTGGHMTTAEQITLSVAALLRNPVQIAALLSSPQAASRAVDELLRHLTVVHFGLRRVATADITVGETVIRAGDGVVLALQSANRDPEVFPDPDRLDLTRSARAHVAFGYGAHRCSGQALAHMELEIALLALFRRLPGLRLAVPFDQVPFNEDSMLLSARELPVAWDPSQGAAQERNG